MQLAHYSFPLSFGVAHSPYFYHAIDLGGTRYMKVRDV